MRRSASALALGFLASAAAPLAAQDGTDKRLSLTIYNSNLALVEHVRPLSIAAGRHRIEFKGVSAQIMAQTVTGVMKQTAQRQRPDGSDMRSFPSGHTSVSFASATVLQRELGWKVGVPAYAVASYVGMARVEKQKHFLSDVAFGAAIGILAGRTVTIGSGEKRFAVSPVVTPGGGAISFSLVGNGKP